MKPVLGSLGANTLVILTNQEMAAIRADLGDDDAIKALRSGIQRGTAHLQAEFADLQKAKRK